MSRSFLTDAEKTEFLKKFSKIEIKDFFDSAKVQAAAEENSNWLQQVLLKKLRSLGDFEEIHPILLGSWSRNELCPSSDLDIIFLGEESKVFEYINKVQEAGLKIRYRVPQNKEDWQQGVLPFDILALFTAKALTSEGERALSVQQQKLHKNIKILRKKILKSILDERAKRQKRLDSITNFLEPNLKHAPGGLRDIEQALQVYSLYSEKIKDPDHALQVFKLYKNIWLLLRQRLHLESGQDIMSGADQLELAHYFGFDSYGQLMKEVEKGLSRSFFYSEWLLQSVQLSEDKLKKMDKIKFKKDSDLIGFLKKDSSILMQKKVRAQLDRFFPELAGKSSFKTLSKTQIQGIQSLFDKKSYDEFITAVFSSRLIDKLLPPIEKLAGHVQHDQYHRFTADIHLQQACRQFLRVRKSAREVGPLAFVHKQLKPKDWEILGLSCLFHDLSKGEGGDHSHKGAKNVLKLLPDKFVSKSIKTELAWLVENHLLLSTLAFKRSSFSWRTLEELQSHGVTKERLRRLVIFTVIDIKATNPEAWTQWKAQLIRDFLSDIESPEGQSRQKFLGEIKSAIPSIDLDDLSSMGTFLLQRVPVRSLVKDLKFILTNKQNQSVQVFKFSGRTWVRFYDLKDRQGLLVNYVERLNQAGASVLHASVQTLGKYGVYDWFQVQIPKGREKLLLNPTTQTMSPLRLIQFDPVEVVVLGDREYLVTLRAKDQKGLLKTACQALSEIGANIKSAQVHTWGLKVEDVFVIDFKGSEQELKEKLTSSLRGNR